MFKPEEKLSMFKVILSAWQHGNERMLVKDVMEEDFNEFIKHRVGASMCEEFLKVLNDDELIGKRYEIAQNIHQTIPQESTLIKNLTEVLNNMPEIYKYFHHDMLDDEEDGEEDV